jgi:hypothetical protein
VAVVAVLAFREEGHVILGLANCVVAGVDARVFHFFSGASTDVAVVAVLAFREELDLRLRLANGVVAGVIARVLLIHLLLLLLCCTTTGTASLA